MCDMTIVSRKKRPYKLVRVNIYLALCVNMLVYEIGGQDFGLAYNLSYTISR